MGDIWLTEKFAFTSNMSQQAGFCNGFELSVDDK